jgi:short-subunit dehydrogenase involved in D-alanine esterification of teichoic acids
MKVVITGHVSGIGKALTEAFVNYNCVGFDIVQGNDVSEQNTVDKILLECSDADIFINNALTNQIDLLKKVHTLWLGQNKTIINISSAITYFCDVIDPVFSNYHQHKKLLDDTCKQLQTNKFPYVMNVRPSWVDTNLTTSFNEDKIKPKDLADLILYHINNREKYQVIDIVIL